MINYGASLLILIKILAKRGLDFVSLQKILAFDKEKYLFRLFSLHRIIAYQIWQKEIERPATVVVCRLLHCV
jgi:hypothetical protein